MDIKNISNFKRILKKGLKIETIYHQKFNGRDEKDLPIYIDENKGVREVSIVQSNSFALKTYHHFGDKKGETYDSWLDYPKASEVIINKNQITVLQKDQRSSKNTPPTNKLIPLITYIIN